MTNYEAPDANGRKERISAISMGLTISPLPKEKQA